MSYKVPKISEFDPDQCYRAWMAKDARFDGRIFVCVTSTGIYCRPICPARLPKKANCHFVSSAAAAAAAGYRPCLRCRPEAAPGTPAWSGTRASVCRALRLIEQGALDQDGVEALAGRVGLGARQLRRLFLQHVGATPQEVAANRRLLAAKQLINETDMSFSDIAYAAGYQSLRRFNDAVVQSYKRPPTALRRDAAAQQGGDGIRLHLAYRPPFNWKRALSYLTSRALPGVEEIAGDTYRRSFQLDGSSGILEVRPDNKANTLLLTIHSEARVPLHHIASRMRRVFDLDADSAAIAATLSKDPLLASRLDNAGGLRVPSAFDGFELAIRAILGQQISVQGATTLAGRLIARCGRKLPSPIGKITHYFPLPSDVAEADLSGLGITGSRIACLKALAGKVASGDVHFQLGGSLEEKIEELTAVPGIGPWTAHYIALRAVGEPDAFPASDLGLRKAAGNGVPISTAALEKKAESWRPWRGYAAMLLWTTQSKEPELRAAE